MYQDKQLSSFYPSISQKQLDTITEIFSSNSELHSFFDLISEIRDKFPSLNYENIHMAQAFQLDIQNLEDFFEKDFKTYHLEMSLISKSEFVKLKKYKNCIFYGEMTNQLRHGIGRKNSLSYFLGILIKENGNIYEGNWRNNYKHGTGIEFLPDRGVYYGQYVNGKPEGQGTFYWSNKESYIGEWLDGKKVLRSHGIGFWRSSMNDSFLGQWNNGSTNGLGLHVWINGDVYVGQIKNNLKHGQGKEYFANLDIYEGAYGNGKPNGYGQYTWNSGSIYKGYFTNGLRNGKGTLASFHFIGLWFKQISNELDIYQGDYINDRKSGQGVYKWGNGTYYEGEFYDDKRNGYGEIVWVDGAYYKGNWSNGLMNGYGEFGCENGVFKGIWKDNSISTCIET